MMHPPGKLLLRVYALLSDHFGPLGWWPADSPFEVVIGAILTQNTAWTSVERAIANLRQVQALTPEALSETPRATLEELIRPSGFFRQKTGRLQRLASHLVSDWQGDLANFCAGPITEVRNRLLAQEGIGPETADSILLYAAGRPSFVIDAYTRRIFSRIGLLTGTEPYEEIRRLFMQSLPEDVGIYNEYHAQIVQLAKTNCRIKRPMCEDCPLRELCNHALKNPCRH